MESSKKPQIIDLSKLDLQGLTSLKNSLDQEVQFFNDSMQQLKMAQMKYSDSGECIEKITPEDENAEILVPLTSCMYVPGRAKNVDKILINLGTGYYVEKNKKGAASFFERKVKFVTEQMVKVQGIASEKTKLREIVLDMMQVKVNEHMAMMQKQQAGQVKA